MTASLIGFAFIVVLMMGRLPIGFAMMLAGFIGFGTMVSWPASLAMVAQTASDTVMSYELTVVPLFILMGAFVTRSGLSRKLYAASYAFLGHRRGGLAMATVVACGGFSAVCGSSLATAATMTRVAMPSMRRYGYADSLATGSIAAGGTLGILIPPSVIFMIFGILTETDIGKLFMAGVLPGLVGIAGYVLAVWAATLRHPERGPPGERTGWRGRFEAVSRVGGVLFLFTVVIGGLYAGLFTPTEAAGVGGASALGLGLLQRRLTWPLILDALAETAQTTGAIYFAVIGAAIFATFVNITNMPRELTDWVIGLEVSPIVVVLVIVAIYIALGCILESLSMIMLTVPVFYPVVAALEFGGMSPAEVMIWFGVIVVVVTEISLITPPVGMNVFVLRSMLPDVPARTIFAGIIPFLWSDIARLALIVFVPWLSLFLPSLVR